MQAGSPSRESFSRRRSVILFAVFSVFFSSTPLKAQDQDNVADAARQERARKAAQQSNPPHVYTDEDLKKNKILVPADQARADARKKQNESASAQQQNAPQSAPQNANAAPAPADPNQTESLGEIARRYRAEKAARDAAEAAAKNLAPFPYVVTRPDPAFAEPKPEIVPIAPATNPDISIRRHIEISPMAPRVPNAAKNGRVRISPFQPRPLFTRPIVPNAPAPVAPAKPVTATNLANRGKRVSPVGPTRPIEANPPVPPTTRFVPAEPKPPVSPERSFHVNPAPSVNATPKVEAGNLTQSVRVHRGDSWWKLAQRHLGSGARWPELRAMNAVPSEAADYLREGTTVLVPEAVTPVKTSVRAITVKKGDTLWTLSRQHLGHASAWTCLAQANPEVSDYTRLAIGSTLRLPTPGTCRTSPNLLQ
jgi:LysM repeat protein